MVQTPSELGVPASRLWYALTISGCQRSAVRGSCRWRSGSSARAVPRRPAHRACRPPPIACGSTAGSRRRSSDGDARRVPEAVLAGQLGFAAAARWPTAGRDEVGPASRRPDRPARVSPVERHLVEGLGGGRATEHRGGCSSRGVASDAVAGRVGCGRPLDGNCHGLEAPTGPPRRHARRRVRRRRRPVDARRERERPDQALDRGCGRSSPAGGLIGSHLVDAWWRRA